MSLFNRAGQRPLLPGAVPRRPGYKPLVAAGVMLATLAVGGLLSRNARAAFLYHGTLLVANRGGSPPAILRIDPATDTVLQTITQTDISNTDNIISDVQVDPVSGNIFVAVDVDGNNANPLLLNIGGTGEVVVFDPFGQYLRTVPLPDDGPGSSVGGSYAPFGVDIDTDGSIWASRPNSVQIVRVANNSTGTVLGQFDLSSVAFGPTDVKVSPAAPGHVFVSDADPTATNPGQLFEVDTTTTPITITKRGDGSAVPAGGFESVEYTTTIGATLIVSTDDGHVVGFDPTGTGNGTVLGDTNFGDGVATPDTAFDPGGLGFYASRLSNGTVDTVPGGTSLTGNNFLAGGPINLPVGLAIAVDPSASLRYLLDTNIGSAFVGQSVTQTLTVTNESAVTLTVNSVAIQSGSTDFSVDADPAQPFTLNPGASASFLVRFTPAAGETGVQSAILRVTSTDPVQPERLFSINGLVLNPNISTNPAAGGTLAFGNICLGDSKTQQIDVANTGNSPLTITAIAANGTGVSVSAPALPLTLVPGGHAFISVTVTPAATGALAGGSVVITSNSGGTSGNTTINVTANTPTGTLSLVPTSLDLGTECLGETASGSVDVYNTGSCDLTLVSVGAPGDAAFAVTAPPAGLLIQPGSHATIGVTFTPSATGAVNSTFLITTNDGSGLTNTNYAVTGVGATPTIAASPNTLAFGNVCAGVPVQKTIQILNTGDCPATVDSIAKAGVGVNAASVTLNVPTLPVTLQPGGTLLVGVTVNSQVTTGTISTTVRANIDNSAANTDVSVTATVATQQIALSPTSLSFGNVCVGDTKTLPVNILNNGGCDLTVASAAISSGGAVYSVQPVTGGVVVPKGGQTTVFVTFAPTTVGAAQTGTLTITSDTGGTAGTTTDLSLTGDAAAGFLAALPSSVAFGNVCQSVPVTKTLTLTNSGQCDLTIPSVGGVTVAGPGAADYTVGPLALPVTLKAGQSVTVPVTLSASVGSGADNATVTFATTDANTIAVSLTAAVVPQTIGFSPTSVSFGSVCKNTTKSKTISIQNNGGCDLTVSSVAITSGGAVYSVEPVTTPLIIPRGGSAPVTVVFAPTAVGAAQTGTLTVTSNTGGTPGTTSTVSLTGDAPAGVLSVSPTALAFGNVCPGVPVTKNIQILNTGNCDLSLTATTLSGALAADYSVGAGLVLPVNIHAGSSITIPVTITPSVTSGADNATLTLSTFDANTVPVALTANVSPQVIAASPTTLDFGKVCNGDSKTLPLSILNKGGCDLTVSSVSVTAGPFTVQPLTSTVIVPRGGQTTVLVTFAPTDGTFGSKSATVTIASDDPATPSFTTTVQGTVPPPDINVSPTSLSFDEVCQGENKTLPVEVINQGDCDLIISALTVSGTGFSVASPQLPVVLAKTDHITLNVTYSGTAPYGAKTGTLSIFSNDPDEAQLDVALSANSPSPSILIQGISSAGSLDFGNVDLTDVPAHTREIQIINTSSCPLHVTGVGFAPTTTEFTLVEASPTVGSPLTIQGGQSVPFHVLFNPTSSTLQTATLVVSSDDENNPSISIAVTGSTNYALSTDLDGGSGIAFPPTVIQQFGKAFSERSPILTNKSVGTMRINSISIDSPDKAGEFELLRVPPTFPLYVPSGGTVGGGNLTVRFHPYQVGRHRGANLAIVLGDPISGANIGTITVPMAGEGVRPGARLLVKRDGHAAGNVKRIELNQFLDGRRPLTLNAYQNVKAKVVSPGAPLSDFVYHTEFGGVDTVGTPKALKPGRYRFVVFMQIGNKTISKEKQFTIGTTTFVDGIVVNF